MILIIATKDRLFELRRLLKSIERQSLLPAEVIVVDSGAVRAETIIREFPKLQVKYIFSHPPSASRQRNEGLAAVSKAGDHIGFADDDAVFEESSFQEMGRFWKKAPPSVGGASFNLANHPALLAASLKTHFVAEGLGLYSSRRGAVLPSGFQTMIGPVDKDTEVKWLPSGAVMWRRDILQQYRFDEWYTGYSYLEDLDFSYSVGKAYRLFVVGKAKYFHCHAPQARVSDFDFGIREVRNRLYFVSKHRELSLGRCYQSLLIRMFLSLFMAVKKRQLGFLRRAWGNLVGFMP